MDAVVTWKLTASEARIIRDVLENDATNKQSLAREIRGESPKQARDLVRDEAQIRMILEKI